MAAQPQRRRKNALRLQRDSYTIAILRRCSGEREDQANGKRYRGTCKTSKEQEAKKVESLVLARLLADGRVPGSKKIPTLSDFSNRFFNWLESLPADRPPKTPTRGYYRVGWRVLESTPI